MKRWETKAGGQGFPREQGGDCGVRGTLSPHGLCHMPPSNLIFPFCTMGVILPLAPTDEDLFLDKTF